MRIESANALAGSEESGSLRGDACGCVDGMRLIVLDELL